jgi:hypothetical protein
MSETVFVIHGVGNRDQAGFEQRVARLGDALGRRWDLKPAYWGDLGADDQWVDLTIPSLEDRPGGEATAPSEIRDGAESPALQPALAVDTLAAALLAAPPPATAEVHDTPDEGQPDLVAAGAAKRLAAASAEGEEIRDGADIAVEAAAIREAMAEHWASTTWLRLVTDPVLLEEIGAAIVAPLVDPEVTVAAGTGEEIRDEEVRGLDVRGFVKRRMDDLDRLVGATIGATAGRVNTFLRTEQGPGVTRFFGDVLVYQRRRAEIHARVRAVVDEVDPALGRDPEHAVAVIGHSLGGVIAVDLATADEPLWTRSLVTFGSQSPFFHVCDPRGGQLRPFAGGELVQLPPSLGAWTNLWEPMDVLAFIAARVFRLYDGSAPIDLPVHHLVSSSLWTHSIYWDLDQVVTAIRAALVRAGSGGVTPIRGRRLVRRRRTGIEPA